MKYILPSFDCSSFERIFAGKESRYATATAISFITQNRLIVAQFLSKMLYLVDVSDGLRVIQSIKGEHYPDLIDSNSNILISSNYPYREHRDGSLSIYDITGGLKYKGSHVFAGMKCHGCCLIDENRAIVTSVGDYKRGLMFVDLKTGSFDLFDDFEFYPKDITICNGKLLFVTSASRPNTRPVDILDSYLYVYDLASMKRETEFRFYGQTDALAKVDDNILVTLQGQHCVAHLKCVDENIIYLGDIDGFTFPHGIDSYDGKIGVTNYGDNSFELFNNIADMAKH